MTQDIQFRYLPDVVVVSKSTTVVKSVATLAVNVIDID